jgi:hypothetical protein
MGERNAIRNIESCPDLPGAQPKDRRIDRHAYRFAARGFDSLDRVAREPTIPLDIELKPASSTRYRGYLLDRHSCVRAENKRHAVTDRAPGRTKLAIGMHQPLVGGRSQQDRDG